MTARRFAAAGLFFAALYVAFFAVVIFSGQLLAPGDARIQSLAAFYSPPALWTDLLLSGFPVASALKPSRGTRRSSSSPRSGRGTRSSCPPTCWPVSESTGTSTPSPGFR